MSMKPIFVTYVSLPFDIPVLQEKRLSGKRPLDNNSTQNSLKLAGTSVLVFPPLAGSLFTHSVYIVN